MAREKTYSPFEASERLGIGMNRVYALLWSKKLKATKEGRTWVITESAINERLAQVQRWHQAIFNK